MSYSVEVLTTCWSGLFFSDCIFLSLLLMLITIQWGKKKNNENLQIPIVSILELSAVPPQINNSGPSQQNMWAYI